MVDEMDLLSGLKTADPVRPRAFEEARAVLQAAMALEEGESVTTTISGQRSRRRTAGFSVAALGAAAAAVAVAVVVTSASVPGHRAAGAGQAAARPAQAAANPILTRLAADITVRPARLPGNATLEIRNQSPTTAQPGANGVDLYTDGGTYYWALSESGLPQVIAQHQDTGQGQFKRDMAAAVYAVNGNIATARARMAVANFAPGTHPKSIGPTIAQRKATAGAHGRGYAPPKPLTPAQEKEHTDNSIWMNSLDALTAAPDNARVRAGVLRIMATMPNVRVTHTTTAGQPTLTLADSWPQLTDGGLVESLVVNASTGIPVALVNRDPGQPLNATYYHASRVALASIEAGHF
jgi:hypothetical protein